MAKPEITELFHLNFHAFERPACTHFECIGKWTEPFRENERKRFPRIVHPVLVPIPECLKDIMSFSQRLEKQICPLHRQVQYNNWDLFHRLAMQSHTKRPAVSVVFKSTTVPSTLLMSSISSVSNLHIMVESLHVLSFQSLYFRNSARNNVPCFAE